MPYKIKKSKLFKGKFEVRKQSGKLFATDLTKKEAKMVKRLGNKEIKRKKKMIMGYKKVKRRKRGRIVRAVAKTTKRGKGRIKKRSAYKKAYPKRGRPKKKKR